MIRELVQLMEKELGELGVSVPAEGVRRIEAAICQQYGGERHYFQKLPKLVNQVRIAAIGTGMAGTALAGEVNLSVRQVRRIVRGK